MKEHVSPEGSVLGVADIELVGKVFTEGKFRLHVSERFYFGEKVDKHELVEKVNAFSNINLVGDRCLRVVKELGWVGEKGILRIAGVPHAHVYKL